MKEVVLDDGSFHGLAIYPRLVIGPNVTEIQVTVIRSAFLWANATAVLRKASLLNLTSFTLSSIKKSSSPKEAESLELLSTLRSVRKLSFSEPVFLSSRAISMISTFPMLENFQLLVTEEEMENCIPFVENNFPAITHLAISSETMNACRLMLLQLQSGMLRSLTLTRATSGAHWSIGWLLVTLHECNLASRLESLHIHNRPWIQFILDLENSTSASDEFFNMDGHAFEYLSPFKQLHDLHLESFSIDLDDNNLMKLAKSLPQLCSLVFREAEELYEVPKCTFTGMQHLIQFCPKLERLTLRVDGRQIPIFADQPDGEYPSGLHLTTLNLRDSPILDADGVASYLTMLFPVLVDFFATYHQEKEEEEEEDVDPYRAIWLKVEELMDCFIP